MPAQAAARRQGPLQIDPAARREGGQGGAVQGLVHHVGGEAAGVDRCGGEAHAVDRHAVPDLQIVQNLPGTDGEHR